MSAIIYNILIELEADAERREREADMGRAGRVRGSAMWQIAEAAAKPVAAAGAEAGARAVRLWGPTTLSEPRGGPKSKMHFKCCKRQALHVAGSVRQLAQVPTAKA